MESFIKITEHQQQRERAFATRKPCPTCGKDQVQILFHYEGPPYHWKCRLCGAEWTTPEESRMAETTHAAVMPPLPSVTGNKNDAGKVRMDLLIGEALVGTAEVLTAGAAKYGARNFERGIAFSRVFAALQRHLWAWHQGEENDPEDGLSHLDHAACNIMFLQTYVKRGMAKFDDRPVTDLCEEDG